MTTQMADNVRLLCIPILSGVAAIVTPVQGLFTMLVLLFGFNIFCGMRADGVSIVRCKAFSFKNFWRAVLELGLYLAIVLLMHVSMSKAGDDKEAFIVAKTLAYIFSYVYLQNALKNLVKAYPKNRAFRFIYYFIRLEFTKLLPGHIGGIIDRINSEIEKKEKENG